MKTELTRSGTCTPHMGIPRMFLDSDIGLIFDFIIKIFLSRKFNKVGNTDKLDPINCETLNGFSWSSMYWI